MKPGNRSLFLGVDVGGTKILAAVAETSGNILARERVSTPRKGSPQKTLETIVQAMDGAMGNAGVSRGLLAAVGLAIPGVVDPDAGRVVVTPNMNLSGMEIAPKLQKRFGVPVALGNDVNLGTLGERWLGAARGARSVVGIFPGTGIGGGIILEGKLVRGAREAAGEVGHMVMQIGGPLCGCGNRGCLEALASRSAIERDIRAAVAGGRKTILTQLAGGDLSLIRSAMLRAALDRKDPLVTRTLRKAAETLGYACLSVRHILDPELIVLGGGLIEACGDFIVPIVERILAADALAGARPGGNVVQSALGDDAVVLGAVAIAQERAGLDPFAAAQTIPRYPTFAEATPGRIVIGKETYDYDLYIRADAKLKRRKKDKVKAKYGTSHKLDAEELAKVCKGNPELLIIGTGHQGALELTPDGEDFLRRRRITWRALPTPEAILAYNAARGRKAALIHLTC